MEYCCSGKLNVPPFLIHASLWVVFRWWMQGVWVCGTQESELSQEPDAEAQIWKDPR